ncbi:apolipoprotein N-acyltransferase [Candidatus Pandoraea novymonadis]|uniref:Apolipoprotein N-acyltransferase n=1 Tax=Candidatus Pandoraea novymonadis TaxID=1808959 RepID=A0ABX5FD67_9BURK|nr:apolipoprotein N-acyltransferase [Candidatus Pandoraea novymonadis]PSB91718.1 Apolipoprotein N-acyltransferase [Candidatus Pandoraea novymonadis]
MRIFDSTLRIISWPKWRSYALASVAGIAQALAFAPLEIWWLQLLAQAGLFTLIDRADSGRHAAWIGGTFGFTSFISGIWWLYISMHTYGGLFAPIAAVAVVLCSLYLSLYIACAAWITRVLCATYLWSTCVFAGAWTIFEWLRGVVFTGFPWLSSGYAHIDGPLAGFAPVLGVYGVGGIAALTSALLGKALLPINASVKTPYFRIKIIVGICVILIIGIGLRAHAYTIPIGQPLTVRLLQGNISQGMKFEREGVDIAMTLYRDMIIAEPADLIITPETAFTVLQQHIPSEIMTQLHQFADTTGSHLLIGTVGATFTPEGRVSNLTNSLFGISPKDSTLYRYDKQHLVPFGEFIPWGFRWFVDQMSIPLGNFLSGSMMSTGFAVSGQRAALDICYEDLFGEEIAKTLRNMREPATFLVNSTNLGWFGNTIAIDQHLQISRMRTLETGRPILRAANTGITAIVDSQGHVIAHLPRFTTGVLTGCFQPTIGLTPYLRFGNLPLLILSILAMFSDKFAVRFVNNPAMGVNSATISD